VILHHIRNATFIIETATDHILVDPMLGAAGSLMPFTFFRFKAQRNPIVDLPQNARDLLSKVSCCLITHLHPDHLDAAGIKFLRERRVPVVSSLHHSKRLRLHGLFLTDVIRPYQTVPFKRGTLTGIPATHGRGLIARPMGKVLGFFLNLPEEKSLYISSDTSFTPSVKSALEDLKPEIAVAACGSAQLDIGRPILMNRDELMQFITLAPGTVYANHLEALNHCPMTRNRLQHELSERHLLDKTWIPQDGESLAL
jgi:L-ascorbate metabolism protein UlaG (beta-lactamase superfamily)